jgi:hypothetical protein
MTAATNTIDLLDLLREGLRNSTDKVLIRFLHGYGISMSVELLLLQLEPQRRRETLASLRASHPDWFEEPARMAGPSAP